MMFLKAEFKEYNRVFDSDLFRPQEWEDTLAIDYNVIRQIIEETYEPYDFDVISTEVLGYIYEQYLGYTLDLTDQQVRYELKPDVRKAGGVYYTPEYIVDYIVKNTVGRLLKELSPAKIKKLRILDPACGSGSFLIRAYKEMLIWYSSQKQNKRKAKDDHPTFDLEYEKGKRRLTLYEKREILKRHIFGVDIDEQAVEVTKLSLMLKMLDGEFAILPSGALLPMLDQNIQCGNSLISGGTLELKEYFGNEWYKAKPFNWEERFRDIMTKENGFDVVIGNPPYGAQFNNLEKKFLFKEYPVIKGQPESYEYFLFRAIILCKKRGYISFIVPTNFIESQRAEGLREALVKDGHIKLISNFRYNVWSENASETLVIVFQKEARGNITRVSHPASPAEFIKETNFIEIDQNDWLKTPLKRFLIRANTNLIRKIEENTLELGKICDVSQGIIVYKTREESAKNLYIADKPKEKEWKKLLDSKSSLKRYGLYWGKQYLKYGDWLWCPRDQKYFELPKILFIRLRNKSLSRKLIGTYDEEAFYNRDNFNNIILKDKNYSLKYVLGLFNCALINYCYR
jgi:type I restriction-modification system DNA methylase subunit